jgi:general secretion pathway protein H
MSPSRSQQGFSLLELVVVLVIVGAVSALVVPRMTGALSNTRLKTAAKQICAVLRYARSTAASRKITRTVAFDLDNARVSVAGRDASPEPTSDGANQGAGRGDIPSETFGLPREVRLEKAIWGEEYIDSGTFEIHFFPNGGSSGGELILRGDGDRRYGIGVDLITGIVRLKQDPEEPEDRRIGRSKSGFAVITPGKSRGLTVIK